MVKSVKKREQHWKKKRRFRRRQKHAQQTLAEQNGSETNGPKQPVKDDIVGEDGVPTQVRRQTSNFSKLSADPEENLAEELAQEAGHGFGKAGFAILTGM
jgi:vacuolar-type H+-ATPase subunit B/Vma2